MKKNSAMPAAMVSAMRVEMLPEDMTRVKSCIM